MKKIFFSILILISSHLFASDKAVKGYADLHVHMYANDAFAGAWSLGDPAAKKREDLFNYCKEGETWPWFKGVIEDVDPYISSFLYRNHCVPFEKSFPAWNDLAHQQVWYQDLKKAHENGLSLMVMSSVHSFVLCKILPDSRRRFDSCEDMDNHLRQLKNAKAFIEANDWVELALTPMDARRIIKEGKLAIIFSVESSNVFENENWQKEFQTYWDAGARTLQIVHQFDNEMAGAALHKGPLKFAQYIRNWLRYGKFQGFDTETIEYKTDFGVREVERNTKGLSEKGKEVIEHMVSLGMPIDFAHMSEQTMNDVIKIIKPKNYPFYFSHGHFRDAQRDGLGHFEKSTSRELLKELKEADGVFGIRTITYPAHQVDKSIQNNCDGSSLSLAQVLKFGQSMGVNIAFGSDFNGFIPQTRPRFSDHDEDYCKGQKIPRLGTNFDTTGLGRIDQLSDLMTDLNHLGVDTHGIEHSAEKFIQLWERSYEISKQKVYTSIKP